MAEDKHLDLLKNLIENRQEIYERLAPRVNIVDILGDTYYEVQNSKLLYYIFNTRFKYYDKEINFAKDFSLYIVGNEYKDKIKDAKFERAHREFQTKEGRRIDILIVFDKFEIIIENKINASDQENQLLDYYIDRNNKEKDIFLVYLTKSGYEASEYSIEKEIKEELKNKIYYLSHGDMAKWIENDILNKYEFLKFDKKYQSIYSALIQIRDNEKIITNPNEENNMEKEEIKNFFEENNYFGLSNNNNELKDNLEALDNCHNLLSKAADIMINKKGDIILKDKKVLSEIDFSEKVSDYIKENMKDLISNNNELFKFKSNDEIKSNFLQNYKSNENIEMFLIKNPNNTLKSVKISLNQLIYPMEEYKKSLYFGVWIHYYQNKEILDKVKRFIEEKFGNDFEEYNKLEIYHWVSPYIRYIDITEDKPEEIGRKIIDLYNLLKEKITQ